LQAQFSALFLMAQTIPTWPSAETASTCSTFYPAPAPSGVYGINSDSTLTELGDIGGLPKTAGFNGIAAL
jgi:hypothetical protein